MEASWNRIRRRARRIRTLIYAAWHGIRVGRGTIVHAGGRLSRELGGSITLGERCTIHTGAMILSYGGAIRIGDNCSINPYCVLYGHGGLTIGDNVRIAAHCVVIPANHGMAAGVCVADQPETRLGIRIGSDIWLGAGVKVLDGAVIHDGCVVAAGAVVRGELQENGVYGGVPARLLRMRAGAMKPRKEAGHGASRPDVPLVVAAS